MARSISPRPRSIFQHALHFTGGNYSAASGIEFFSRKQSTQDPWEPMPMDIVPDDCKDIYMLHVVRFDTDTIPAKYPRPLNAFLYLPCWECEKLPKMDQCLAGTWRLSNDSLISFLQSRRVTEEVNYNSMKGQIVLTMNPDGTAQWLAEDVAVDPVGDLAATGAVRIDQEDPIAPDAERDDAPVR